MLEINSWHEKIIPNIFETRSVFNSPEDIERDTIGEEAPHFEHPCKVVVNVICIVAR